MFSVLTEMRKSVDGLVWTVNLTAEMSIVKKSGAHRKSWRWFLSCAVTSPSGVQNRVGHDRHGTCMTVTGSANLSLDCFSMFFSQKHRKRFYKRSSDPIKRAVCTPAGKHVAYLRRRHGGQRGARASFTRTKCGRLLQSKQRFQKITFI